LWTRATWAAGSPPYGRRPAGGLGRGAVHPIVQINRRTARTRGLPSWAHPAPRAQLRVSSCSQKLEPSSALHTRTQPRLSLGRRDADSDGGGSNARHRDTGYRPTTTVPSESSARDSLSSSTNPRSKARSGRRSNPSSGDSSALASASLMSSSKLTLWSAAGTTATACLSSKRGVVHDERRVGNSACGFPRGQFPSWGGSGPAEPQPSARLPLAPQQFQLLPVSAGCCSTSSPSIMM
jgi:hypothetical protein